MKIIKSVQIKTITVSLVIISAVGFFGCTAQKQLGVATNQKADPTNLPKAKDTPKASPTIEVAENTIPSELPETEPNSNQPLNKMPVETKSKGKLSEKLTKTNFDKINVGMTHDEVAQIFDDKGMQTSEMHVNGHDQEMFMWSNDNFSKRISVTFEKDKVLEKTQSGL